MDNYVTGAVIKRLRENKKMTQEELAEKIFVTSKAVSKWETGKGFPDVVRVTSATIIKNDGSRGELEPAINSRQPVPVDAGGGAGAGL